MMCVRVREQIKYCLRGDSLACMQVNLPDSTNLAMYYILTIILNPHLPKYIDK